MSILNNSKNKGNKDRQQAIVDDEPLIDEKIDINQAKLKVDKKLLAPVKNRALQRDLQNHPRRKKKGYQG